MEKAFISVIVTAYNRKQFLLEALKSVVNQTLSRDKYEVIVTKNFGDEEIDKFISDNKMKSILFADAGIGQMLSDAIKVCEGEVITFLDDDDMYVNSRVEAIYKIFSEKNNIIYFWNNSYRTRETKNIKNFDIKEPHMFKINGLKDLIKYGKEYNLSNLSSIAVRRKVYSEDFLNKMRDIYWNVESLVTIPCLLSDGGYYYIDNRKLTIYRIHTENSSLGGDSAEKIKKIVRMAYYADLAYDSILKEYDLDFNPLFVFDKLRFYFIFDKNSKLSTKDIFDYVYSNILNFELKRANLLILYFLSLLSNRVYIFTRKRILHLK